MRDVVVTRALPPGALQVLSPDEMFAPFLKITRDGALLSIIGQLPFDFTGVLKINLDTGDVVHEPSHDISGRLEEACDALTA